MEIEFIKKTLSKNGRGQIIIGIVVGAFGLGLIALFASGVGDKSDLNIAMELFLWAIFIGFFVLGVWVGFMGYKLKKSVDDGTHKLIHAIESGDKGFVIWFYEFVRTTNGVPAYQVVAYGMDKKCYRFGVKNQEQSRKIFGMLSRNFPQSVMGYSPDIAKQMKEQFGLKIRD